MVKIYVFRYYGIEFEGDPKIEIEHTDKGFALELVREDMLPLTKELSNVVKILLDRAGIDLHTVPVSWKCTARGRDGAMKNR
jgi:hypothetical protein